MWFDHMYLMPTSHLFFLQFGEALADKRFPLRMNLDNLGLDSSQHVVYLDITNRKATGIKKREKQRYSVNGEGYNGLVLDNGSKKALTNDVRISEAPKIASFWHII